MPVTITDTKANPTLLAFTPRQVLLGSRQTMKHNSNNNGSSNGTVGLKLEQKVLLHQSIAHYLECSGFSKSLKKFRSEAKIEKDKLDGTLVDLQEMWLKCLEVCKDAKANNNNQKEQGKHSEKDGDSNLTTDIANGSKKKKKKTDKSDSDAVVHQSGTDENFKGSKNSGEMTYGSDPEPKVISKEKDADKKCKEKKKKKSKLASESLSNDGGDNQFESPPTVTKVKLRDNATAVAKTVNGETKKKSKDKNKKRDKPSCGVDAEELQNGDPNETVSKKDDFETANEHVTDKKKDSKKRKRLTSEEIDVLPSDGKVDEEPKRRKIENLNESKGGEQSAKMNGYLKSDLNSSKENIGEKGQSNDKLQRISGEQLDGKINGDLGNTGKQSSMQKSQKKQQKGSVEQKAVKAFQRVKTNEVVFADERLQDNSYWAKDGAEIGYGAKAEEILGQVRGRDFRHEKTKKKRGTYRGGQIDLQSHSIKFSYSDDD